MTRFGQGIAWMVRLFAWVAFLTASIGLAGVALAQDTYPNRPIKLVIPYPAGGNTDLIGRQITQALSARLGQPVVVENKAGANGIVGAGAVAQAAPDGYTMLMVIPGYALSRSLYTSLPYSHKDLAGVSLMTQVPLVLVTSQEKPFKTFPQLLEYGRDPRGELNYGTAGVGSMAHMLTERFGAMTGMKSLMHVPYKGTADALSDLLSGRISLMFDSIPVMTPHIRSGKLNAVAVTGKTRTPFLPDVPTVGELGYPDLVTHAWSGLLVPARTPRPIIEKLSREVAAVLASPELKAKLAAISAEPVGSTPQEFETFLDSEAELGAEIVKRLGISLQ